MDTLKRDSAGDQADYHEAAEGAPTILSEEVSSIIVDNKGCMGSVK
jgi:hypothetical protein